MNQVLKDARVWVGAHNFSGDASAVVLDYAAELQDDTALADSARSRVGGLKTVAMQCEGFWNAGVGEIDEPLHDNIGLTDVPVSLCAIAGAAEGERAFTFLASLAEYQRRGQVGELFRFSAGAEARGVPLIRGQLLHNAVRTVSGNGSAWQLGALSSSQRLYAALHVLAASGAGPSLTVKVQSDDAQGFGTPTDRITFAAKAAIGYEWLSVPGTIADTWWRVNFTIAGGGPSFLFVVVAGILG